MSLHCMHCVRTYFLHRPMSMDLLMEPHISSLICIHVLNPILWYAKALASPHGLPSCDRNCKPCANSVTERTT